MILLRDILESGSFNHAMQVNRKAIYDAWTRTPYGPDGQQEREQLYVAFQAVESVKDQLVRQYSSVKGQIDLEQFRRKLED